MSDLWNSMKGAAASVGVQQGQNRWGIVTSVRQTSAGYDAKVLLQPEGVQSAWLPILTSFGGAGWGLVARPSLGMQAFIASDLGDGQHGVVLGMAYSTQAPPPKPPNDFRQEGGQEVSPTELAIVHKSGSVIRMCDDGSVFIHAAKLNIEANVTIQGDLTVNAAKSGAIGDIHADANVQAGIDVRAGHDVYDVHGALETARVIYNSHRHGNSGGPTPTIPE